jgi:hypothetical protein
MVIILVAVLTALALLAALLLMVRGASSASPGLPVTAEWIDELSPERYRPMMRLLDDRDVEFLRSQPGFTPKMATKMRAQRVQIFRGYLRTLDIDFQRVCTAVKILTVQSQRDRPDLAIILLRQKLAFSLCLVYAEMRLVLYRYGLGGMNAAVLVNCFDVMRLELRSLVPVGMSAAA